MKKIITAVCLTVLVLTSCQQAKQKVFEIASQEVNKQCPMTIDEMTRMDSTSYTGGDNTFTYYYTLTGAADDPNIAETTQKHLEENLPGIIKNTDDLKMSLKSWKVSDVDAVLLPVRISCVKRCMKWDINLDRAHKKRRYLKKHRRFL